MYVCMYIATLEIKPRHGKSNNRQEYQRRRRAFHLQIGLEFKERTIQMPHFVHSFVWLRKFDF